MQETSSTGAARIPVVRSRSTFMIFAAITVLVGLVLSLAGYGAPVVMGIVQGLGEFLPISSSAHLILTPWFFGWSESGIGTLTFDIALHLGTLVAIVAYFWRDWLRLIGAAPGLASWTARGARGGAAALGPSERLLAFVIVSTIPGAILGLLLKDVIETSLRQPLLIAATLPALGVLLYIADRFQPQARTIEQLTWTDALLIGLSQGCALLPGVSRSGATITMSRVLKLDRSAAARYSFLLSAPITGAAVLLKLEDMLRIAPSEIPYFAIGTLISAAVGALAIHFLLGYIRRAGFAIFAAYRIALSLAIVAVFLIRGG